MSVIRRAAAEPLGWEGRRRWIPVETIHVSNFFSVKSLYFVFLCIDSSFPAPRPPNLSFSKQFGNTTPIEVVVLGNSSRASLILFSFPSFPFSSFPFPFFPSLSFPLFFPSLPPSVSFFLTGIACLNSQAGKQCQNQRHLFQRSESRHLFMIALSRSLEENLQFKSNFRGKQGSFMQSFYLDYAVENDVS